MATILARHRNTTARTQTKVGCKYVALADSLGKLKRLENIHIPSVHGIYTMPFSLIFGCGGVQTVLLVYLMCACNLL